MTTQPPSDPNLPNPQPLQNPPATGDGPGENAVKPLGITLISVYVIALVLFSGYLLIKVWPHCAGITIPPRNPLNQTANANRSAAQTTQNTNSNSSLTHTNQNGNRSGTEHDSTTNPTQLPSSNQAATNEPQCQNPTFIEFFWRSDGYWIWEEVRLLLIVIIAGVLGALLHVIRSLFWYVGHRDLRSSWMLMYILLPFTGPLLAVGFYFLIRGGFFPQANADQSNPIGFAALAFLMGLFTAQAGMKLKQVFETIFTPAPPGANARPQLPAPTVTAISPITGSITGGQPVLITGTNFTEGATVRFGEAAATSVRIESVTVIKAVTPAHPAGIVDVTVTDKDGKSGKLANGYTFTA